MEMARHVTVKLTAPFPSPQRVYRVTVTVLNRTGEITKFNYFYSEVTKIKDFTNC